MLGKNSKTVEESRYSHSLFEKKSPTHNEDREVETIVLRFSIVNRRTSRKKQNISRVGCEFTRLPGSSKGGS